MKKLREIDFSSDRNTLILGICYLLVFIYLVASYT
jgi:hypothetical protein